MIKNALIILSFIIALAGLQACQSTAPSAPAKTTATCTSTISATHTVTRNSTPVCTPTVTATYTVFPLLVSISPDTGTFLTGSVVPITVSINQPAPVTGYLFNMYTTGGCSTVPYIVTIPGGSSSIEVNLDVSAIPCAFGITAIRASDYITGSYTAVDP